MRLAQSKSLGVAGDTAIVEGTEAAAIHPDAALDDAVDEDDEEEDTEEENGDDEEEADKGLKKGATLKLTRRLEAGTFRGQRKLVIQP